MRLLAPAAEVTFDLTQLYCLDGVTFNLLAMT
jgi:hypothetical protein